MATQTAATNHISKFQAPNWVKMTLPNCTTAKEGQARIAQCDHGRELLRSLRFFEAEKKIHAATVMLQSLDNQTQAQRGKDLLDKSAYRQSIIAYALLLVGVLLLFFTVLRRVMRYLSLGPLEVEYR